MSHHHSASPYTPSSRPIPLPSPSISPSINSLLNNSVGPSTNDLNDYFGQPAQPPQSRHLDPHDFFANDEPQAGPAQLPPPQRYLSPTGRKPDPPRRTPSGGPAGLSHLLSVDTGEEALRVNGGSPDLGSSGSGVFEHNPHHQGEGGGAPGPAPVRTHKRPRTGDSDASGRSSVTPVPPALRVLSSDGEGLEAVGEMPPPARRMSATARPSPSPSNHSSTSAPPPPQHQQPTPAPQPTRPDPHAIEPSIFGIEPLDEFTREVADWIWGFSQNLDPAEVEIEAKIGVLIDREGQRCGIPVPTESILMDTTGLRFESNMTPRQHKGFNQILNTRVEQSADPAYPFHPIRYSHTREADFFHQGNVQTGGGKVRVTRDQKTGNVLRTVKKDRIADMNIYSPKRLFDWRISVSTEQKVPKPSSNPTGPARNKDRISYAHQLFTIDLTQVTGGTQQGQSVTHELEIEFKDARVLLVEARKDADGQENRYLEMVQAFLNNVRMLIRNAAEP